MGVVLACFAPCGRTVIASDNFGIYYRNQIKVGQGENIMYSPNHLNVTKHLNGMHKTPGTQAALTTQGIQLAKVILPTPWIACRLPLLDAQLRLICFSHAGGGASVFRTWANLLQPHQIELCAIQLPGRESRFKEQAYSDLEQLLDQLTDVLAPFSDLPCAFFGHSMGGLLAFALAQRWQRMYADLRHVIVSAATPVWLEETEPPIHLLPDAEFLHEVVRLNGIPDGVLENQELMSLILPTLRADFALCAQAATMPMAPLNCPLSVYIGTEDPSVEPDGLALWRQQTRKRFRFRKFPGDHFYLWPQQKAVMSALMQDLFAGEF